MDLNGHKVGVLIAIDGSKASQIAATLATQIAMAQHKDVKGLYIVDARNILEGHPKLQVELGLEDRSYSRSELVGLFKAKGEETLSWLEKLCHTMNVGFQYEIVFGRVDDIIVHQSLGASLVAFGKIGFGKAETSSNLGENSKKFIHKINIPLLVGDQKLRPLRNVLVVNNGGQSAERALRWANVISEIFQSKIYVSYFMEDSHANEKKNAFEGNALKSNLQWFEWVVLQGDPGKQLEKVVANFDIDLMIVGNSHRLLKPKLSNGINLYRLLCNVLATTLIV